MSVKAVLRAMTPAKFKRWLEKHPKTAHVGEAGEPLRCPLANFVKDTTGVRCRIHHGAESSIRATWEEFYLPEWADEFAHRLDVTYSNAAADGDDLPEHKRLRSPDDHVEAREALVALHDVLWPRGRRKSKRGGGA